MDNSVEYVSFLSDIFRLQPSFFFNFFFLSGRLASSGQHVSLQRWLVSAIALYLRQTTSSHRFHAGINHGTALTCLLPTAPLTVQRAPNVQLCARRSISTNCAEPRTEERNIYVVTATKKKRKEKGEDPKVHQVCGLAPSERPKSDQYDHARGPNYNHAVSSKIRLLPGSSPYSSGW